MPATYEKHRKETLAKIHLSGPVVPLSETDKKVSEKPALEIAQTQPPSEISSPDPAEGEEVLTSLDMLQEVSNGDSNFIRGILEKLVVKLPEAIQELKDALAQEDWETIRATSHRTKSSAAYSGAAELKEKFRILEHMAREQEDLDQVPAKLQELEDYVARVVGELEGHLQGL
jgi:HPt (histidine-containing phosphotransfer) domain-containing protein